MSKTVSPIYVYGLGFCHHECSPLPLIVPFGRKKQPRIISSRYLNFCTLSPARKVRRIVRAQVGFVFVVLFLFFFLNKRVVFMDFLQRFYFNYLIIKNNS